MAFKVTPTPGLHFAVGGTLSVTVTVWQMVETVPSAQVMVRQTLNVPHLLNWCIGLCNVEVLFAPLMGSPKFHDWLVAPTDWLIKLNLPQGPRASGVKAAVQGGGTLVKQISSKPQSRKRVPVNCRILMV